MKFLSIYLLVIIYWKSVLATTCYHCLDNCFDFNASTPPIWCEKTEKCGVIFESFIIQGNHVINMARTCIHGPSDCIFIRNSLEATYSPMLTSFWCDVFTCESDHCNDQEYSIEEINTYFQWRKKNNYIQITKDESAENPAEELPKHLEIINQYIPRPPVEDSPRREKDHQRKKELFKHLHSSLKHSKLHKHKHKAQGEAPREEETHSKSDSHRRHLAHGKSSEVRKNVLEDRRAIQKDLEMRKKIGHPPEEFAKEEERRVKHDKEDEKGFEVIEDLKPFVEEPKEVQKKEDRGFLLPDPKEESFLHPEKDEEGFLLPEKKESFLLPEKDEEGFLLPEKQETFLLPEKDEEGFLLPEKNAEGYLLPEKKEGYLLPEKKEGYLLPEKKEGYLLPEKKEGYLLPENDEESLPLPEKNGGYLLPEKKEGYILPEKKEGFLLPEKKAEGYLLPEKNEDYLLPEKKEGYLLPEKKAEGYLFPEKKEGYLLPEKKEGFLLPEKKAEGYLLPEKNEDYLLPEKKDGYLLPEKKEGYLFPDSKEEGYLLPDPKEEGYLLPDPKEEGYLLPEKKEGFVLPDSKEEGLLHPEKQETFLLPDPKEESFLLPEKEETVPEDVTKRPEEAKKKPKLALYYPEENKLRLLSSEEYEKDLHFFNRKIQADFGERRNKSNYIRRFIADEATEISSEEEMKKGPGFNPLDNFFHREDMESENETRYDIHRLKHEEKKDEEPRVQVNEIFKKNDPETELKNKYIEERRKIDQELMNYERESKKKYEEEMAKKQREQLKQQEIAKKKYETELAKKKYEDAKTKTETHMKMYQRAMHQISGPDEDLPWTNILEKSPKIERIEHGEHVHNQNQDNVPVKGPLAPLIGPLGLGKHSGKPQAQRVPQPPNENPIAPIPAPLGLGKHAGKPQAPGVPQPPKKSRISPEFRPIPLPKNQNYGVAGPQNAPNVANVGYQNPIQAQGPIQSYGLMNPNIGLQNAVFGQSGQDLDPNLVRLINDNPGANPVDVMKFYNSKMAQQSPPQAPQLPQAPQHPQAPNPEQNFFYGIGPEPVRPLNPNLNFGNQVQNGPSIAPFGVVQSYTLPKNIVPQHYFFPQKQQQNFVQDSIHRNAPFNMERPFDPQKPWPSYASVQEPKIPENLAVNSSIRPIYPIFPRNVTVMAFRSNTAPVLILTRAPAPTPAPPTAFNPEALNMNTSSEEMRLGSRIIDLSLSESVEKDDRDDRDDSVDRGEDVTPYPNFVRYVPGERAVVNVMKRKEHEKIMKNSLTGFEEIARHEQRRRYSKLQKSTATKTSTNYCIIIAMVVKYILNFR